MSPSDTLASAASSVPNAALSAALWTGDVLPLGVLLIDPQRSIVRHLNGEAKRLLGLPRAGALNTPASQCLPAELAATCTAARWQALRGSRTPARQTLALATRHGQRWLKIQLSLLPPADAHEAPTGLLTLQDASAERQLERALQESDLRFREVTEAVSECLFVTNPSWNGPAGLGRLDLPVREAQDVLFDRVARLHRRRDPALDLFDQHENRSCLFRTLEGRRGESVAPAAACAKPRSDAS